MSTAAAATRLLERHADIDLLLSAVVLPGGTSGPDFAEQAKRRRPGLKVLFMSGYVAGSVARHGNLDDDVALLSKPSRKAELARMVREMIEAASRLKRHQPVSFRPAGDIVLQSAEQSGAAYQGSQERDQMDAGCRAASSATTPSGCSFTP